MSTKRPFEDVDSQEPAGGAEEVDAKRTRLEEDVEPTLEEPTLAYVDDVEVPEQEQPSQGMNEDEYNALLAAATAAVGQQHARTEEAGEEAEGHGGSYAGTELEMLVAHLRAQQESQAQAQAEAEAHAQDSQPQADEAEPLDPDNLASKSYAPSTGSMTAPTSHVPYNNYDSPLDQSAFSTPAPYEPQRPLTPIQPINPAFPVPIPLPPPPKRDKDKERREKKKKRREKERELAGEQEFEPLTQALVLQTLTSLTSISTVTGIDLNTLTATLLPSLRLPSNSSVPAVAGGNPLMALLAQLQIRPQEDEKPEEEEEKVEEEQPNWAAMTEEEILNRGAFEGETEKERKERRKRNRMVLSCTECHRRKCVKRGVSSLCQMEIPYLPPPPKKKKKENPLNSSVGLSTEAANKIFSLEAVLRTNPGILQSVDGGPGIDLSSLASMGGLDILEPKSANEDYADQAMDDGVVENSEDASAQVFELNAMGGDGQASSSRNLAADESANAGLAAYLQAQALQQQQQAQQGQQQDAAALIAQLSQSLVQQQQGGAGALAGSGLGEEGGQGALLMDVLQHLSGTPGKVNAAVYLNNLLAAGPQFASNADIWSQVPPAMPETSVQVQQAFDADTSPNKLNLGLPGFREDDGKIFVPPTVRSIERKLYLTGGLSHESLPIEGHKAFLEGALKISYGTEGLAYKEGRIAAVQAISLTGGLRLGATFLARHPSHPPLKSVYIPNPTCEEDAWALKDAGLEIRLYRFFDRKNGGVDWEGMKEDLQTAPPKSIVLLHVSGSTPTGAELSLGQWRLVTEMIKEQQHIPFFVMEFQGLSTGDVEKDAQPLRFMAHEGIPLILAQTFDASMGLYADSPTIVSVVANTRLEKQRIESQLKSMARAMHGHPPPWGAHVAAAILSDTGINAAWLSEIKAMAERLKSIREKLFDQLTNKLKTPGNWGHFRKSMGMYSTCLLNPAQLHYMATHQHIHLLPDGCFSLGCLNAVKIDALANAIDKAVRFAELPTS